MWTAGDMPGDVRQFRQWTGEYLGSSAPVERAFRVAGIFFARRGDKRTKFYIVRQDFLLVFVYPLLYFFRHFLGADWFVVVCHRNARFGGVFFWQVASRFFTSGLPHNTPLSLYVIILKLQKLDRQLVRRNLCLRLLLIVLLLLVSILLFYLSVCLFFAPIDSE